MEVKKYSVSGFQEYKVDNESMERQDLVDYMLFATSYRMLADCLEDENKFRSLWNNVINSMMMQGFAEARDKNKLFPLPTKSEMESSKYVSAYKKAIEFNDRYTMKFTIVDNFLKEHQETHKDSIFYEGDLCYWEDINGRRLYLEAKGNLKWRLSNRELITNNHEAIKQFPDGDKHLYDGTYDIDLIDTNWTEMYAIIDGEVIREDTELNAVIDIDDFMNLPEYDVEAWLDWFERGDEDNDF